MVSSRRKHDSQFLNHSKTFEKKAASNPQAGEFFLSFVVKFFNIQLWVKTAFHSLKKLLSFHTWLGESEWISTLEFLSNKVEVAGCLHLSRKILKRDRNCHLYIVNK